MRASSLLQKVEENSRDYERSLREIEREISSFNSKELKIEGEIANLFTQMAAVQIDNKPSLHTEVLNELEHRVQEEKGVRRKLADVEGQIASVLQEIGGSRAKLEMARSDVAIRVAANPIAAGLSASIAGQAAAAGESDQVRTEILDECARKLPVYDSSALFQYLLSVGYGAEGYSRTGVFRALDGWVAGLCNFAENRDNHALLLAMRKQVQEAEWQADELAASLERKLNAIVHEAEFASGFTELSEILERQQARVKELKQEANQLQDRIGEFVSKTDPRYMRAKRLLADTLSRRSDKSLLEAAAATPSAQDDALAREIIAKKGEVETLRNSISTLEKKRQSANSEYARAKSLERSLSSSRYSGSDYKYSSGLDLSSLVMGYMAGRLSESAVLGDVMSHRRTIESEVSSFPANTGFGGSGFSGGSGSSGSSRSNDSDSGIFSSSGSIGGGSFDVTDSF